MDKNWFYLIEQASDISKIKLSFIICACCLNKTTKTINKLTNEYPSSHFFWLTPYQNIISILEHVFDPFSVIFSHFLSFFLMMTLCHFWSFLIISSPIHFFSDVYSHFHSIMSFSIILSPFYVIFSHFVIFPQNDSKSCFVIFEHFKGWTVDIKVSHQF